MIKLSSDFDSRNEASRLAGLGRLVRLAQGIYSTDTRSTAEEIVTRDWMEVVARVMPGAVVTGRTGFAFRPVDGYLFVSYPRARELKLPGLTVVADGTDIGDLPGDVRLRENLFGASEARALIDNREASRARGSRPARTLSRAELHDEITRLVDSRSRGQQQRILDAVAVQARERGLEPAGDDIRVFFDAARGDAPTVKSKSRAMRAAQDGRSIDQRRVESFHEVSAALAARGPHVLVEAPPAQREFLPFFEAYFSNYIEGTEFDLDEAYDIAYGGEIPADRPADAHDIAGTFRIVNDETEMRADLHDWETWIEALRRRHRAIMEGRPEKHPAVFKVIGNRAGTTVFVHPDHVDGTLRAGFEDLQRISDPFHRAVFTMYFISEVHPFDDGNGRAARVMMNSELARARQTRIIIPTIARLEYLSALSSLTNHDRADGLVSVLDFVQRWTAQVDWADFGAAVEMLERTNALEDSALADRRGLRLLMPADAREKPRQL